MQSMNGVNLNLFQFEYDLTWMSFFMDANDRFYTRYGGREDAAAETHLTKASLLRVMKQVLDLHPKKAVQTSRYEPKAARLFTPEQIPPMKAMMARRKEKCIHCHDVKVARLEDLRQKKQFLREMVFTYPSPSNIGIAIEADMQNRVKAVVAGSPAAKAGLKTGDTIASADGQRILTYADFTRVLELTPKESSLPLHIQRGGESVRTALNLSGRWRQSKDPSWRESLHVAGPNGGFWGRKLSPAQKKKIGVNADDLAVQVTFIWGKHTRQAGIRNGDVVLDVDGIHRDMNIKQIHAYMMLQKNYGDSLPIVVHRGGKKVKLKMNLPATRPK